jgi:hypothetical protein
MNVTKEPAYKFPKSMGACADMLFKIRDRRLEMKKVVDALEEEEKALKEHIINTLPKSDTGAQGKTHRVSVVTKTIPQVKDWNEFYKYIKRTNNFDLLQRRLSETAVSEIWDTGKTVPGVSTFQVVSVSLTKI